VSRSNSGSADVQRLRRGVKRAFDAVASFLLLVALLPMLLLIAAAVKLDSRGPVFYRVRRVGYRGRPLMMLKFRKMHHDSTGVPLTARDDHRLTRVGTVLHSTRLDELPQFWDVLCGRMSIIGPRPEDPAFVALHAENYARILAVRPGITGISQLAFAGERDILDADDVIGDYVRRILPQKVGLDTLYADGYRISLDLAVIRWTLVAVLLGRPVAVNRSTLAMGVRKRPRAVTAAGPHVPAPQTPVKQIA
jgi:lipopolysaccharide/colanic/teichoic acid biosynthesis glycosyltransferase